MLTLTVSAGTEEDAPASRAVLTEAGTNTSPWKWETGDKLLLVTNNGVKNVVSTLELKSTKNNGFSGEFEGEVTANSVKNGTKYRFYYVGKNTDGNTDRTISASEAAAGNINIDLTKQTGELKDLKRNCVLMGEGKLVVKGTKATVDEGVVLNNLFAVAHIAVKASDGTPLTKVGMRGKGVYASANVNLLNGTVTGVSEVDTEIDPETNIFFPKGKTDFYVTFVPGSVAPSFDGYYAGTFTSSVLLEPEERNYDERKSFVYLNNKKAAFSVSATQQVAFTNGNMQYVMPIATFTANMRANTLKANTLIRWKNSVALKLTAARTAQRGYYRLAPEQWETAVPRNDRANGTYTYNTVTVNGKEYVSPETYRYFDMPSWGTVSSPTAISNEFTPTSQAQVNYYSFGKKLKVGGKETRVLTSEELVYLMPQEFAVGLPNTKRVWKEGFTKTAKWARCFIDENGDKKRNGTPVELMGFIIFPDDMKLQDAKNTFTRLGQFGKRSEAEVNATTYENIRRSGAVFLPFSGYRASNSKELKEWGNHGNYSTSSYTGNRMMHAKLSFHYPTTHLDKSDDSNQGCMTRLVQNY